MVIVNNLDGETIESCAYKLFREFVIGDADKDNELLLLAAIMFLLFSSYNSISFGTRNYYDIGSHGGYHGNGSSGSGYHSNRGGGGRSAGGGSTRKF